MSLKDQLYAHVLPYVRKPSRYLGTEFNAVHKDPRDVALRVALVFPDLYELGLGNLGLHILYAILNDLPWCWAERAYAPAPDMESLLRAQKLPLFAQESKDPLSAMDLIGFTFQSELTYTNVLNIIDLAGIPLRAVERGEDHPLLFAGGPTATNPEPMAPFMDFMVIGDGEEVILEIAERVRDARDKRREDKLGAVAAIDGVYVPTVYPVETLADGRVLPRTDAPRIVRRVVSDLDAAVHPTRLIVPFTQLVHDRIGLEVFRGCTHGCRFCHAGMIGRPVRERELPTLDGLMREALRYTGHEELSLVSLSTCDYTRIGELLNRAAAFADKTQTAVSLPSLRLDTFSVEMANRIAGIRRAGLTFAPEAATPRLRAVINKGIPDEQLLDVAEEAFRLGWGHIKCYFMIGLPTETDEDVEAIADLCLRVLERGRRVNPRAEVFTSVSTFVPKPFTPFQWAAQISPEEIRRRQGALADRFRRRRGIKFGHHEAESTFIEGLIARGDRRAANLIEAAFRSGARFETDTAQLNPRAWGDAIDETGYDVSAALRARDADERLPWDHVDVLIPKAWLWSEWLRALEGKPLDDCRQGHCNLCGVRDHTPDLCAAMVERAGGPRSVVARVGYRGHDGACPSTQRLRFRIGRHGEARFLSHLEWATAWIRALRRAEAPLSYSQGFHAHPKVTFATAPPVGEESEGDYMDAVLRESAIPEVLLRKLQATLPVGFAAYEVSEALLDAPSLMSSVAGFDYTLETDAPFEAVQARIRDLLAAKSVMVERKGRPEGRRKRDAAVTVDIRPAIYKLTARTLDDGRTAIDFTTMQTPNGMAKPRELARLLGLNPDETRVIKRATLLF
jgi:radical SAM family uncharacterized protein/radical SAM-linked protein